MLQLHEIIHSTPCLSFFIWSYMFTFLFCLILFFFTQSLIIISCILNLSKFISHASKVMLKILQARLQQYVNHELPDVQAGFRRHRGTRDQIANICWIITKQESSAKTSTSPLFTMPKPLTVWITANCGKFLKRWEYQATWLASWGICMQVKKQQLELDMEQQTGSK